MISYSYETYVVDDAVTATTFVNWSKEISVLEGK